MLDFKSDFAQILALNELSQKAIYKSKTAQFELDVVFDLAKTNEKDEGRSVLNSAIAFTLLPQPPQIYDELIINQTSYKVIGFSQRAGVYKLSLVNDKRQSLMHSSGAYR